MVWELKPLPSYPLVGHRRSYDRAVQEPLRPLVLSKHTFDFEAQIFIPGAGVQEERTAALRLDFQRRVENRADLTPTFRGHF